MIKYVISKNYLETVILENPHFQAY